MWKDSGETTYSLQWLSGTSKTDNDTKVAGHGLAPEIGDIIAYRRIT